MKKCIVALVSLMVLAGFSPLTGQEIDLIERAGTVRWSNTDDVSLQFGADGESAGTARYVENSRLEDGQEYQKVLFTHPQWKTRGSISGSYPNIAIPANGGKLIIAGGFLEGAKDSDGAFFTVHFLRTDVRQRIAPGQERGQMLCSFQARYDGQLDRKECDLSRFAGQTGEILLQVSSGMSADSDWAVWTEAKLIFGQSAQAAQQIEQPPQEQPAQTASGQMRMLNAFKGHNSRIDALAVSANGQYLLTVDSSGESKIWQLPGGRVLNTIRGAGISASPVFSPDSRTLVLGRSNGEVEIYDVAGGSLEKSLRGHAGAVNSAAFSPNGRYVVSAGSDGTAKVWDVRSGGEILSIRHSDRQGIAVRSAAFSPDNRHIITAGDDDTARIWEVQIR